ncbi:hypothetical protein BHM03_00034190 [Ensete ventricosum]|nr:hypothetical protein BHM03_00034190 [Ensete ventricosum]
MHRVLPRLFNFGRIFATAVAKRKDKRKDEVSAKPGSRVTGKAVMLDEIINYVQSLQQQVEVCSAAAAAAAAAAACESSSDCSSVSPVQFLSMKLAAVNAQHNYGLEGLVAKEVRDVSLPLQANVIDGQSSAKRLMQSSSWEEDLSAAMKLTNGSCALINAKPCDDFTM